jgi:hypothetical protein
MKIIPFLLIYDTTQKANKDEQHEPNHNWRWTYVASGTTIFRLDFGSAPTVLHTDI